MGNVSEAHEWTVSQEAGDDARSTISRAADASGRHIVKSMCWSIAGTSASAVIRARLRDGPSDTGTIFFSASLAIVAGTDSNITLSGLNILGTKNTAMTVEFDIAGGAGTFQSVSMSGYTDKDLFVGV